MSPDNENFIDKFTRLADEALEQEDKLTPEELEDKLFNDLTELNTNMDEVLLLEEMNKKDQT